MRVFNVPSSAPFLKTVIAALIDGRLVEGFSARETPERLADATIYLPTRRAGRIAREIFLDVLGTGAAVLPRIVTLGNIDDDDIAFADTSVQSAFDLPPALGDLERRFLLAQMIAAWAKSIKPDDPLRAPIVIGGPASTLALAGDLARLMDDFAARGVSWDRLDTLVPDQLDEHWQSTFKFLSIAKTVWPDILTAQGKIEPMTRINRLMEAESKRLAAHHKGPVIVAGSTGSRPASAMLLNAIAHMENGAVVLPGLDLDLDDDAWSAIGGQREADDEVASKQAWSHPQFALHHLLTNVFRISRDEVTPLADPATNGRDILMSEVMRPASASAEWHVELKKPGVPESIGDAMKGLTVIESTNPEMEALAIAIVMREAREMGESAALVTPDRALARRVMSALTRWNLEFDDSGGDALTDAPAGIFARLVAETITEEFAPATLLSLLKHPLFRLGEPSGALKATIADLELAILRGTRPAPGSAGLKRALAFFRSELDNLKNQRPSSIHRSEPRAKLEEASVEAVSGLIEKLAEAFAPLETIPRDKSFDTAQIALCHRNVLIALSTDENGTCGLFDNEDGRALAAAFDEILNNDESGAASDKPQATGLLVPVGEYLEVFEICLSGRIVRGPQSPSAQLRIYGLLEARLTNSQRVILGGLVEGVWPPQPRVDPWLSRPMRTQLGLDLPERRIGLTAHDLAQLLGIENVYLSYAAKHGGSPAVASRFLHRMKAVAGQDLWKDAKDRGDTYVSYASAMDRPAKVEAAPRPEPKPPVALRPLRMSVTEVEDLFRDPYTIYAKHILKLAPLDQVDTPLTAADRGSAIHEALGDFTLNHPITLPPNVLDVVQQYGLKHFTPLMERPEAKALWWPRFLRIAEWFAKWEQSRRSDIASIESEIFGHHDIALGNGRAFRLTARADRIERRNDGTVAILDYKTGRAPSGKEVRIGLSPQLTLEGAILRKGGFKSIPKDSSINEFLYVHITGNTPPGEADPLVLYLQKKDDAISPDEAADEALAKLTARIRQYEDTNRAYLPLVLPRWKNQYGRYDDLARVKEWSAVGGTTGGAE